MANAAKQRKGQARVNVYTCQKCGAHTVTVDVDEGVTPFMIGCQNDSTGCHGDAHSSFYPRGPKPPWLPEPQWEWYKPNEQELSRMSEAMRQHCKNGGLDIRKRTNKAVMRHAVAES